MEARSYTSTLEESAVVERVARIVSSVRGSKPDYTRLAAELEQAIPFDVFGIVLLRHDRQAVRVVVCQREKGNWKSFYHQLPREESKLERMLQKPEPIVADYPDGLDGPPSISGDALSGYHQLHSTIIVPLLVEDRVLGTLELGSTIPDSYTDKTLQRLISAVVRVLASAIESAQLGGSAEIQDRQRQALKDVSSALTSRMDLSAILDQIVLGIAKALNVASLIVLHDRRVGRLSLEAQAGLDQATLDALFFHHFSVRNHSIMWQTLQRRQSSSSQDIATDHRFPDDHIFYTRLGVRSILSYPLATGSTVYGALLLCSPEAGGFTPLKTDIVALFANQATLAIHNSMLLEAAHQRSRFQQTIEELERAHERSMRSQRGSGEHAEEQLREEYALLSTVREETQRTFGVSFTSLLRIISDHLLTQRERDLPAILYAKRDEQFAPTNGSTPRSIASAREEAEPKRTLYVQESDEPLAETVSLLTHTAEAALVRAGMLGELSRLLMQLKQSTDGVRDAWFVVDLSGICLYMNPAADALCNVRLEDLSSAYRPQFFSFISENASSATIVEVFASLLPRVRNADELSLFLDEFAQQNLYQQELRFVLAEEPISIHATPERSAGRASLHVEGASSDHHYQITRYPLHDQQGQLSANALQVSDVTEQVRDEKNRSALLSSVSHDLRTPLTTIKAAVTGLLQEDVAWEEVDRRAMLEDIDTETDHLTVLINALVELSRLEMGALILEKEWCDVVEVIYGTLARMERILAGREVHLRYEQRLPLIYVDHAQIERVFYNLIENAARTSPDVADIDIVLDILSRGQPMLRARIIDYGEGVPEQERERVFKSFHSMHSYGNGLGLAICKGIIEAHQGRIGVEGREDGGSCFVFFLPLHQQRIAQSAEEAETVAEKPVVMDSINTTQLAQNVIKEGQE